MLEPANLPIYDDFSFGPNENGIRRRPHRGPRVSILVIFGKKLAPCPFSISVSRRRHETQPAVAAALQQRQQRERNGHSARRNVYVISDYLAGGSLAEGTSFEGSSSASVRFI